MIVVSNTSPLLNLATIKRLDLVHQLYGTVLIPPAVYDEIVVMGAGKPGADLVREAAWITVRAVQQTNLVRQLHRHLDAGEAESIVLAQEQGTQLLLIDEQQGRRIAAQYGLVYTGLLGVLVAAKRQGILGAVTPLLDALRYEAGFWISQPLYDRIIDEVGE